MQSCLSMHKTKRVKCKYINWPHIMWFTVWSLKVCKKYAIIFCMVGMVVIQERRSHGRNLRWSWEQVFTIHINLLNDKNRATVPLAFSLVILQILHDRHQWAIQKPNLNMVTLIVFALDKANSFFVNYLQTPTYTFSRLHMQFFTHK